MKAHVGRTPGCVRLQNFLLQGPRANPLTGRRDQTRNDAVLDFRQPNGSAIQSDAPIMKAQLDERIGVVGNLQLLDRAAGLANAIAP
jgi:hypothetical protein